MGELFIVSTPIGNLEDITLRGLRTLREADLIAAEDTRHAGLLLRHFGIDGRLLSLHEHNENERIDTLLAALDQDQRVALISDAGTPTLSDPGYRLVRAATLAGHRVTPVPGASAALAALVASGLPTDRFLFCGFPPRRPAPRRQWLIALASEPGTMIIFESAQRLPALLIDIADIMGYSRPVVIARELTKHFETFWRGEAGEAARAFAPPPPGEIVVLIGGAEASAPVAATDDVQQAMAAMLAGGLSPTAAARLLAGLTGLPRRQLYTLAITLSDAAENVGET